MVLMSRIGWDTPLWQTDLYMVVFGAGLGLNMQTIVLAMQNAVAPQDMGVATSSTTFFRQMGGTLGTAVFLSILFSSASSKIGAAYASARHTVAFQAAARAHPDQLAALHSGSLNDTSFLHTMAPALAEPFRSGFSSAMDLVFLVGAGVLVLAFLLALMLKEVPLRTVSGAQARAAAAADSAAAAARPDGADDLGIPGVPGAVADDQETVTPTTPR
jgi:hypothetical protein